MPHGNITSPSAINPLPCPFCGHSGLSFSDGSTHRWGVASCRECGASAGETRREYPDKGEWHARAIAEWNTRAPLALAEALEKFGEQHPEDRVAQDGKDAERLRWFVIDGLSIDEIGGKDLHEEASVCASALGRDEPNDDDYLAAIRTAIDAAMTENSGSTTRRTTHG